MNNMLLKGSDKQYWHRFVPIYEERLKTLNNCNKILEFGVFKGDSIRWLNELFPNADIYGSDILAVQPEWPIAKNVTYYHVDQGDISSIKNLFQQIKGDLNLIIEDGSHFPEHQKNCLVESLKHMTSGGIYILEDIHTSHPEHPYYNTKNPNKGLSIFNKKKPNYISPLHLLLCLEHLFANQIALDKTIVANLAVNSLFTQEEIILVSEKIATIEIFRRATLPHKCYSCHSSDFDYHNLKCKCGVNIYSNADSMTILITVK